MPFGSSHFARGARVAVCDCATFLGYFHYAGAVVLETRHFRFFAGSTFLVNAFPDSLFNEVFSLHGSPDIRPFFALHDLRRLRSALRSRETHLILDFLSPFSLP